MPDREERHADYAEWPALMRRETFDVMHLGGWGYFMPGLHYLRTQAAPRLWPITGIIHSLHGRDTIDHAVHYDQTNTAQALAGTTVRCPSLAEYLPVLVRYVLDVTRGGVAPEPEPDDVHDPLDQP